MTDVKIGKNLKKAGDDLYGNGPFRNCISLKNLEVNCENVKNWWFSNIKSLENIVIGDYVKKVEANTFKNNTNLRTLKLGEGLENIGSYAFAGCSNLENSIIIPQNVIFLGEGAFYDCNSISRIILNDKIEKLYKYTFENCTSAEELYIGKGVKHIESDAFLNCSSLKSIVVPENVETIDYNAFNKCANVTLLDIDMKEVGGWGSCLKGVKKVFLRDNVEVVKDYAFNGNGMLEEITFNKTIKSIGYMSFNKCSALTSLHLESDSLTDVYDNAFANCSSLKEVYISSPAANIRTSTFEGCDSIISVYVDTKNVSKLFNGKNSIENVILGDRVEEINNDAFANCGNLSSVVWGKSIVSIGNYAFAGCRNIPGNLNLPKTLVSLGNNAFASCKSITAVSIPQEIETIGKSAFYACSNLVNVYIPEGIEELPDDLFAYCKSLKEIEIPNSVRVINSAFNNCDSLKKVTIGSGIEALNMYAFNYCNSIEDIYVLNPTPAYLSDYVFDGVYSNARLYIPVGSSESYKAASRWKNFKNIIEMDMTSIDDIEDIGSNMNKGLYNVYYDMNGRVVTNPQNGIYILNGKKVLVK